MIVRMLFFAYTLVYAEPINIFNYFPSPDMQEREFVYEIRNTPGSEYVETLTVHEQCVSYHRVYAPFEYTQVVAIGEAFEEGSHQEKKIMNDAHYDYTLCWNGNMIYAQEQTDSPLLSKKSKWQSKLSSTDANQTVETVMVECERKESEIKMLYGEAYHTVRVECDDGMGSYAVFADKIGMIESGNNYGSVKLSQIRAKDKQ
ncbi:hypothetical protein ACXWTF_12100 [Thiomicrolovo sp. ZZH C-3]